MSQPYAATVSRSVVYAAILFATIAACAGCAVGVGPGYAEGAYGYYPSDAFIATTNPFYYQGRANYWYGGRWNYRNGNTWGYYGSEPAALYNRRMQGSPVRQSYEPSGGRPSGGGHSGGRSGGHR
jgi:hypothetical protein